MKVKTLPIGGVKAGPEDGLAEGEFIVYPSTFTRKADAYGDVIAPGAFLDDIATRKESGNVLPGLYGHRMDDPDFFVAEAHEESEDDHGWRIKGAFDLESPKGAQVYRLVKGRRLNQLSFAYDVLESGKAEDEAGESVNELRKLKVYEFSFVPIGANQDTSVVAVKALAEDMASGIKAGRVLSTKNESALREARDSIDSVLASLDDEDGKSSLPAGNDQEKARGNTEANAKASAEEPPGANAPVEAEEPKSSPSVEFLATQLNIYALKGAERGSR